MSDNISGLKITTVSPTTNADGSTPITLEDGTVHNLKAGIVATEGQFLVIDTTNDTVAVVDFKPSSEIEVTETEPATIPLADAIAQVIAATTITTTPKITFASGAVAQFPATGAPVVGLLDTDLLNPVVLS